MVLPRAPECSEICGAFISLTLEGTDLWALRLLGSVELTCVSTVCSVDSQAPTSLNVVSFPFPFFGDGGRALVLHGVCLSPLHRASVFRRLRRSLS